MPDRWPMDGASTDCDQTNTSNQTITRQVNQQGLKRKKDFSDQGIHKRVVSIQLQGTGPARYSIVYQPGSREQLYILQNDLRFHCTAKTYKQDEPPIIGGHLQGTRNCPVKQWNEPPTRIVVPAGWQPRPPKPPGTTPAQPHQTRSALGPLPLFLSPLSSSAVLTQSEQDKLQALTSRSITLIVQPDQTIQNLQVPVKPTDNIWVFVGNPHQLLKFMPNYRALKAKLPGVSLCLMAPRGFGSWRTSLKGMHLFKKICNQ